ncbi:ATP-binding cassette domain-containing protein [Paenibacillus puldeungensis]|uniref:ATP-binding cassette domain-containing protein n=1 Tax=Paenibacillus puldeungensis TaxID=696536 RepID=A0ABW3RT08_9BACL
MGSSGAGKSTLMYALSGMDKPTLGSITFFDQEIAKLSNDKLAVFRRANCGFVFQQMFLLDNMSILDNILAAGLLVSNDRKAITARAKDLLTQVGLTETRAGAGVRRPECSPSGDRFEECQSQPREFGLYR